MTVTRKPAKTRISVILDESGSMFPHATDVMGGFNQFVSDQRKQPGKTRWSLTTFNSGWGEEAFLKRHYTDIKGREVPRLTENIYRPKGGTPLLDAVGTELTRLLEHPDTPTIVFIFTDGEENTSKEYSVEALKKLIKKGEKAGWQFIFMGADIDAFADRNAYGFRANTTSVQTNWQNLGVAYAAVSNTVSSYRATGQAVTEDIDVEEETS